MFGVLLVLKLYTVGQLAVLDISANFLFICLFTFFYGNCKILCGENLEMLTDKL